MTIMKASANRSLRAWSAACLTAVAMLVSLTGCATMTYDRIRLGASQSECRQLLDQDVFHSCNIGFSGSRQDAAGRTDAVVVLLGRDGVVGGKLQATVARPRGVPLVPAALAPAPTFQLRGELDLVALSLAGAGPLDVLRAVLVELMDRPTNLSAEPARELVAAGIVRLMERWPNLDAAGQFPDLADTLERVPSGGVARLGITAHNTFFLEYEG
ncbi:MAG TPA: hypothetical protein P5255_06600 [Phycisphaerae bacterium]|nr:hypothetical protein [Phycisphaerae bacterium]